MKLASIFIAAFLLLVTSCTEPAAEPSGPAEEPETLSRTEFSERVENYFEFEPLRSGKPSQFLIHLTDLADGSPVEQAGVTLDVRPRGAKDAITRTQGKVGKVTGIYVAELTISRPGEYDIEFHIRNTKLDERMPLTGFKVE
jgi:hypothetical protein